MARIPAGITFAFLAMLAAVLLYERRAPKAPPLAAGQQEMIERLKSLGYVR